ncbi:methionine biosynthesis PLP-dependent protein [Bacillus sp. AG4(2022)]|nr:methionine biosynthesis PLP-dependent protein [Bacillus sp. AG4(2022)]MDT0158896.1 methionine biosynthesis PLP-dependent protein [Bacillus sp. AG4(2022)]
MVKTETLLAQLGNRSDQHTGTVNPPVYFSTAYRHEGIGKSNGYDYVRTGNPTREILEQAIASLEGADQGYACSSGMSAISVVLSLFRSGDELVVSKDLYGGTYRLLEQGFAKWGLVTKYADTSDIHAVSRQISPHTKAIFLETPTNPLMQQADIEAMAAIARQHGILLIVDNTFFTPVLQQPIRLGADIVIHSATKYLGGHNDVLAGLIAARGEKLCASLAHHHNAAGAVLSPFDSWLLMRGMKTLALRMKKHESNARKLAEYLNSHEYVEEVLYPGKGGMLSFRILEENWADLFLQKLNLITFAESLGGTESFITYPATQTHADIPGETRLANGICGKLLRFSVGIEDPEDLMKDLEQAFSGCVEGENAK